MGRGDWENASRSDLLLIRKAIKEGWPVPPELRRPIMKAALSPLHREDTPARMVFAIARLMIAADRHALEMEEAEAKLRTLSKLVSACKTIRPHFFLSVQPLLVERWRGLIV